ncbi:ISNCY family transposase [Patescibacteria group bacterium]|nr:ISNCY family transposase [Patescibacteria group bacterium]
MTQELITMTSKELSRYEIIKRLIKRDINGSEAAKQLGLSVRQTKRIKAKVINKGAKGVIHSSRGRTSNRKLLEEKTNKMEEIVRKNYYDFGPTFASEKLEENHNVKISNEKLRQLMIKWKLWKVKSRKKNKQYRRWRPRKEQYGEMQQFDGSYHKWFENRGPECCLLASIDDATGKITKLKFVDWEGVKPAFIFWKEYTEENGKPINIYLDRHSTYKQNAKSLFDDPKALTQFQRAMEDLGIKVIHAYSPQAKGRAERLFGTLQDRLIKELRLANIKTKEETNVFCDKIFISKFNAKFSVLPQRKRNLHRVLTELDIANLERTFSIQNARVVSNDFTVRFLGKWFQLAKKQPTLVLRKDKVLIEERINGTIFISLRNKYLDYKVLLERPKRVKEKITALTRTKSDWKPAHDHPWKKPFVLNPASATAQF